MFQSSLMGFQFTGSHQFLPISFILISTMLILLIFIFQPVINSFQKLIIQLIFNSNSTKVQEQLFWKSIQGHIFHRKYLPFVIVIQFAFDNQIIQYACNYLIKTTYTATGPGNIMQLNPVFSIGISHIVCKSSCFPLNMLTSTLFSFSMLSMVYIACGSPTFSFI